MRPWKNFQSHSDPSGSSLATGFYLRTNKTILLVFKATAQPGKNKNRVIKMLQTVLFLQRFRHFLELKASHCCMPLANFQKSEKFNSEISVQYCHWFYGENFQWSSLCHFPAITSQYYFKAWTQLTCQLSVIIQYITTTYMIRKFKL